MSVRTHNEKISRYLCEQCIVMLSNGISPGVVYKGRNQRRRAVMPMPMPPKSNVYIPPKEKRPCGPKSSGAGADARIRILNEKKID